MDEDGNELAVREDNGDGDDEDDGDEGEDNDNDGDGDGNDSEDEDEDEALNLGPVFSWLFGDVDAMDGPAPEPTSSSSKVVRLVHPTFTGMSSSPHPLLRS